MSGLTRDAVVAAALDLLDEVGLDAVSTRALARRLEVEQPSLYWHFRSKGELLAAMAGAALASHDSRPLPAAGEDWRAWLADNTRSFRRALLARRDGARLHAGSRPQGESLERVLAKRDFLVASGLARSDAEAAMLSTGWFTVGSVLEQQSTHDTPDEPRSRVDHEAMFEAGLALMLDGISPGADRGRAGRTSRRADAW